jgi:phage terminase large subunit-like protein
VSAYHDLNLDRVVGEVNFGGDMIEAVIRQTDRNVPYKPVRASRGKRIRAEPVKALYEQGRVHHVGVFPELEAEMVQWIPDESVWSPNRLDALVWAITDLAGTKIIPDVNWAAKAIV